MPLKPFEPPMYTPVVNYKNNLIPVKAPKTPKATAPGGNRYRIPMEKK